MSSDFVAVTGRLVKARKRPRPGVHRGAVWPIALQLAASGTPIGVLLFRNEPEGRYSVVTVDADGLMVLLADRPFGRFMGRQFWRSQAWPAVRWCHERHLRIFWSLGGLLDAMRKGEALGWVPDRIVEHKHGRTFIPVAVPFVGPRCEGDALPSEDASLVDAWFDWLCRGLPSEGEFVDGEAGDG